MRWMIAATVLGLLGLSAVVADIPRPRPEPKPNAAPQATFAIEVDANATEAKLIVPRKIAVQRGALDVPNDGTFLVNEEVEPAKPAYPTMIAGLSLAAAISCAGLWLVRRGKFNGKMMIFVIAAAGLLGGSALVWANVAPPPGPKPQPPAKNQLVNHMKVTVEYVAQGDTVKLIVPPEMAKNFGAGAHPGTGGSPPPAGGAKPSDPTKQEQ